MTIEVDISHLEDFMKHKCNECRTSRYSEDCPVFNYRKLIDGIKFTHNCWIKRILKGDK